MVSMHTIQHHIIIIILFIIKIVIIVSSYNRITACLIIYHLIFA